MRGVAVNTSGCDDREATQRLVQLEREIGLPVDDPVGFGADRLAMALLDPELGCRP